MKRLICILILGFGMITSQAQYYFNERNTVHSYLSPITSVLPVGDKYFCTGLCVDSVGTIDTLYFGTKFLTYNSVGNITRDTVYQLLGKNIFSWSNNLYPLDDSEFLLASYDVYLSDSTNHLLLSKINHEGVVKWHREYDQPYCISENKYYTLADMKPTGTGEWLLLAAIDCKPFRYQGDFVLTKLDSSFNIIWQKTYGDPSDNDAPWKILVTNDGYVLAGEQDNANILGVPPPVPPTYESELIKTDTSGTIQWTWLKGGGAITMAADVIRTHDKGYLYCGERNTVTDGWKGWVEKLDSNRNVLWNDTIGYFPTDYLYTNQTVLKELSNGDIVMAGAINGGFDTTHTSIPGIENYGSLVKFSKDGIVKWERQYSMPNDTFEYRIFDMKQTPDNGYVLVGDAADFRFDRVEPVDRTWIIKVDSNGCMSPTDPQCHPADVQHLLYPQANIKIYPYPVKDILQVSYSQLPEAQFVLTDITGRVVAKASLTAGISVERINVQSLPAGMYLYRVIATGTTIDIGKVVKE